MDNRTPLPEGYVLRLDNGGEYIIKKKIAAGGFSLVYDAETCGGTTPVVIKEFFPDKWAMRNEQSKVCPLPNRENEFSRCLKQFIDEGKIGGHIATLSFQTVSFLYCGSGYALMQRESEDMISIADVVGQWEENPPTVENSDPVFTDFTRLRYSLQITESVLSVLSKIHELGYLHLDISGSNVLWAGGCAAFIADYGCAVSMTDGVYKPSYQPSYSPGFSAPELLTGLNQLSPATDIYSVGMLLYFLCAGRIALDKSFNIKKKVSRNIEYLKLPKRVQKSLIEIILTSLADQDSRYSSASDMLEEIRKFARQIPLYPINSDNTRSFTLYSLKSMLEGRTTNSNSWLHELCDRRNVDLPEKVDDSIFKPLTTKTFVSDIDFLKTILPEELFECIEQNMNASSDKSSFISGVMNGNYPNELRNRLVQIVENYGTHRLLQISNTVLKDKIGFINNRILLFQVIDEEGDRLKECYYNVADKIQRSPYIGLAMLILYALLCKDGFAMLIPSPSDGDKLKKLFSPL
ncbi:MAG: protein kinase [Oscillospiraceae bacterium]|nr:protein kinase [Oscillospiraceae bacterium]